MDKGSGHQPGAERRAGPDVDMDRGRAEAHRLCNDHATIPYSLTMTASLSQTRTFP